MDRYITRERKINPNQPEHLTGNQMIEFSPTSAGNNITMNQPNPGYQYTGGNYMQNVDSPGNPPAFNMNQNPGVISGIDPRYLASYANSGSIASGMRCPDLAKYQPGPQVKENNFPKELPFQHKEHLTRNQMIEFSPTNTGNNITMNRQIPGYQMYTGGNFTQNVDNLGNTDLNIKQNSGAYSGIDSRYLASYADNSAAYISSGASKEQLESTKIPINAFAEYQNRTFVGAQKIEKSLHKSELAKYQSRYQQKENIFPKESLLQHKINIVNKAPELSTSASSTQIQVQSKARSELQKELYKQGPRTFSGPLEMVLKWHKSLQDIGVVILYEIVAKCVNVRAGESCAKNLVLRDENGPAMQVVYYEIDFLMPEIKPPCTVRVIGRMLAGTNRLQAYSVRLATSDDVATMPRRTAIAAHHVSKLCKEYGLKN
ncbi:uncharacterized protein LOC123709940 isoform X2 [Pieris brassicae]|uniref:uncharacterized protein LOC123709940 isoform X2 n=1 Tax=Pieris brassicae TaxID=7116 RepID=UPI001E662494|nr:uncharacterized protein LOC123709940 isoform X2 [Pieris brassicae]